MTGAFTRKLTRQPIFALCPNYYDRCVMKIILAAILFVFMFTINSSAASPDQETIDVKLLNAASQIEFINTRLQENYNDLIYIIKSLNNPTDQYVMSGVSKNILGVYYICFYEKDLLATNIFIEKNFMAGYLKPRSKRLETSISRIQSHLESSKKLYPYVTNNAALHVIDKSHDSIKSLLTLLERCNKEFQAELNKKTQNMNK